MENFYELDTEPSQGFDTPQISLLQVALEDLQDRGIKDTVFGRIVMVSRLKDKAASADELRTYHQQQLARLGPRRQEVTGMLIVYPPCITHVLEAPYSVLLELLRNLQDTADSTSISGLRIIYSKEGLPNRSYTSWRCAYVDGYGSPEHGDPLDRETLVQSLWEFTLKLVQLGTQLSAISGEEKVETALKSLNTFADIPRPELLLSISNCEDAPSLPEYLELYDAPLNLDLESELVWPTGTAYTSNVD